MNNSLASSGSGCGQWQCDIKVDKAAVGRRHVSVNRCLLAIITDWRGKLNVLEWSVSKELSSCICLFCYKRRLTQEVRSITFWLIFRDFIGNSLTLHLNSITCWLFYPECSAERGYMGASNNVPGYPPTVKRNSDECAIQCGQVEACAFWTMDLG